jgi:hypothetical protein
LPNSAAHVVVPVTETAQFKTGKLGSPIQLDGDVGATLRGRASFSATPISTLPAKKVRAKPCRLHRAERTSPRLGVEPIVYPLTAPVGFPSSAFGSDVRSHCPFFLLGFFPFSTTTHASLQLWPDPARGRAEALDLSSRNERFDLFSPPLKRLLAQVKKGSPLSHPPLAFRACGCGPDRPRQLIAIEAAMVAAQTKNQGE